MYDGQVIIGTEVDTSGFDDGMDELEKKGKQRSIGEKISEIFEESLETLKKSMKSIGTLAKSIGKGILKIIGTVINSVVTLGLKILSIATTIVAVVGILGLAGAGFLIITKAIERVFKDNQQIKADIKYIIFAITTALDPAISSVADLIEKIVKLLFSAIQYINYIIFALTGKNIFANATPEKFAEKMAEAEQSTGKMVKNAKELNKQLTKFDEMEVLQDKSSSGGGDDTGSILTPSFDLSKIEDVGVPKWLQWILDNGETVLKILVVLGSLLVALKLGLSGLDALLTGLVISQIILQLTGIVKQIGNWIDFIKDPSWDNFFKLIKGFPDTLGLLGIAIDLVVDNVLGGWDNVEKTLKPIADWIMNNLINPVVDNFKKGYNFIVKIFEPIVGFFKNLFDTFLKNVKITFNNLVEIFKFVWNKIKEIFSPVATFLKDKFLEAYNKIKTVFSPLVDFFGDLWTKVKNKLKDFGTKVGEIVGGAFKTVVNAVLGAMENLLNAPVKSINALIGTIKKVAPNLEITKLKTFSFPRLERGGIVNNPGPGVMMGSYIAGERGPEAVLPLTDEVFDRLGMAIAKYTSINANITNTMNGRVISRELKRISAEDNFAFNR